MRPACASVDESVDGQWTPTAGARRRYRIGREVMSNALGTKVSRERFYGQCDASGYEWTPRTCTLPQLSCSGLSGVRSIAMVGDSIMSEMFLSLVFSLGGGPSGATLAGSSLSPT